MSLQTLSIVLSALSALAGLAAAVLWFLSALVRTPENFAIHVAKANGMMGEPLGGGPFGGTYVGHAYSQDLIDLANALRRQSRLSGKAAILTAIAVILQTGALATQISVARTVEAMPTKQVERTPTGN
jgi:hypothetical protein